jgi:hypothetical protein
MVSSMREPISLLVEICVQIAWYFLERSGEIDEPFKASRFLEQTVFKLVYQGERRRLMLANKAIAAYRQHRQSQAA